MYLCIYCFSLLRSMRSKSHKTRATGTEDITDGIDIQNWTLRYNNRDITFNAWDFAGQTVYYNTHQVKHVEHSSNQLIKLIRYLLASHSLFLLFSTFIWEYYFYFSVFSVKPSSVYSSMEHTSWLWAFWLRFLAKFYLMSRTKGPNIYCWYICRSGKI